MLNIFNSVSPQQGSSLCLNFSKFSKQLDYFAFRIFAFDIPPFDFDPEVMSWHIIFDLFCDWSCIDIHWNYSAVDGSQNILNFWCYELDFPNNLSALFNYMDNFAVSSLFLLV